MTFSDLGGSSKQCMRGSDFPYGDYQLTTEYSDNKYVKYSDTLYIDPVQCTGLTLLSATFNDTSGSISGIKNKSGNYGMIRAHQVSVDIKFDFKQTQSGSFSYSVRSDFTKNGISDYEYLEINNKSYTRSKTDSAILSFLYYSDSPDIIKVYGSLRTQSSDGPSASIDGPKSDIYYESNGWIAYLGADSTEIPINATSDIEVFSGISTYLSPYGPDDVAINIFKDYRIAYDILKVKVNTNAKTKLYNLCYNYSSNYPQTISSSDLNYIVTNITISNYPQTISSSDLNYIVTNITISN